MTGIKRSRKDIDISEYILCACGCNVSFPRYRYSKGEWFERKYINGHNTGNQEGSNNRNYKGGWVQHGYHVSGRKNNRVHRQIYEQYYNCCLLPIADIHHKDGNKLNNIIKNLQPIWHWDHTSLHHKHRKR